MLAWLFGNLSANLHLQNLALSQAAGVMLAGGVIWLLPRLPTLERSDSVSRPSITPVCHERVPPTHAACFKLLKILLSD